MAIWAPRLACEADVPQLEALIPFSVRTLQAPYYSLPQMEAALGPVFGVDHQLIRDGSFFVVEKNRVIIACGGWSRRRSLFGESKPDAEPGPELDPLQDPARIRAFFVHPNWARQGLGRALLLECETAIRGRRFARIELVATLAGEPLYATHGYRQIERFEIPLPGGLGLPAVRMGKSLRDQS